VTPLVTESSFDARVAKGDGQVSVIVKLEDAPLATYAGDVPGLAATSPAVIGADRLDARSAESQAYLSYLKAQQESFIAAAQAAIPDTRVTYRYDVVFGGVAMRIPRGQVDALAQLPGVEAVYPDELLQLDTERSPQFIGAPRLWRDLGGTDEAGEGVIVGVLDTGIWPEHPSFSDPDPSGNPYPAPPADWAGTTCEFGSAVAGDDPFTCNNKLIGAYRFMDTYDVYGPGLLPGEFLSARDDDGHGTHTTSTAAGNAGVEASIFGIPRGTISGIAPRAHVVMYKVCGAEGCYHSDSAAAVQQAVLDGVDAINFSIGGGRSPYTDIVSLAFLDGYAAGMFVACSAGNSGPGPDTVGHREPWVTTVGASITDRLFLSTVKLEADNDDTLRLVGATVTDGIDTPTPVVLAADYGDGLCLEPFPAGTFSGEIVVCERGEIARVEKSFNVAEGGAGGLLLYNPVLQGLNTDNHFVPSVHLENDAGAALLGFMAAHSGVMGTFTQGEATEVRGDLMAPFSSRGGPGQTLGISKPDVTAPGVQILAGNSPMPSTVVGGLPGELFQSIQGTSMSSPHVAGAAALLRDLHPDWTPGQIRSALMTTAKAPSLFKEDGVTPFDPFDAGSGRINLRRAGHPGLTFDASAQDYVDHEHDLWNANYPSLYVPVMPGRITVRRTVHSEFPRRTTWSVRVESPPDLQVSVPRTLSVPAGGDARFEISVDARDVPLGETRHAVIHIGYRDYQVRFPITIVRQEPAVTLEKSCDPASFPRGDTTGCTITMQNTGFDDAHVSMVDELPWRLELVGSSVVGGDWVYNSVDFNGTLAGAEPPIVTVGVGTSPAGYLPLSSIGAPPNVSHSDESCVNFSVDPFVYAGETYTRIGMVSNGYAVAGGCTGSADIDYINQIFPDPAPPNNVFAPFWTDINPENGGNYYAYSLTDGTSYWLVLEWEDAPNWGDGELNSFQIWVGTNGVEDISFTYGTALSDGDGSFLTVGAEDAHGLSGDNYYADGAGTLPTFGVDVVVTSVPGTAGGTHVVTFEVEGQKSDRRARPSKWTNCAEMTSDAFFGTNIACFSGEVTRP
jgi:subtilisin family serine protease